MTRLVAFCGLAGSGKDTSADFLVDDGFVKVALADPLKRICRDTFQFTEGQLWGPSSERNKPDLRYKVCLGEGSYVGTPFRCVHCDVLHGQPHREYLTPRFALQQLGTEWGRVCYPNVWVEYAMRVAKELLETQLEDDKWQPGPKGFHRTYYSGPRGLYQSLTNRQVKGVTISDVRFINEIEAINAAGGCVYQLLRGQGLSGAAGQHKSETEMLSIPKELFKGVIDNRDWSLGQLQMHMRVIQQDILKGH